MEWKLGIDQEAIAARLEELARRLRSGDAFAERYNTKSEGNPQDYAKHDIEIRYMEKRA